MQDQKEPLSEGAQQLPPRSAAEACVTLIASPSAANNARRLQDNVNTDFIGAPLFYRPQSERHTIP